MNYLTVARYGAVIWSLGTLLFIFLRNAFRSDNIFLVPDLILAALLIVAALSPKRIAPPLLLAGFSLSAGVFMTSVASSMVAGQLNIPSLVATLGSVIGMVLVARHMVRGSTESI
ncbi:MAG: hypothetical protein H0W76_08080 [Pyrinomonadaceae bacterium]|nr:hypothetical protein [Pyrinomonadaceae bacterium]